jgi:phosphatidylglycerophosphate synthase
MLDRYLAPVIKPAIDKIAKVLHKAGVSADFATLFAFALGIIAAWFIASRRYEMGLVFILVSRLFDGLDGAIARQTQPTDRGGFLDISLDFLFYASIPLAFAWAAPVTNGVAAATLLASFIGTGASFLAFAVIATKKGLQTTAYPNKSFYFLGGLTESTETLIAFCAMCLWPKYFTMIALGFAGLCCLTIVSRIWFGWRNL